jgi:hypothetical protein
VQHVDRRLHDRRIGIGAHEDENRYLRHVC